MVSNETLNKPTNQTAGGVADNRIGRVASPIRQEATSAKFFFWAARNVVVEKTQLVSATCTLGGQSVTFYGVVEEVYRRSRQRSIDEEIDGYDGDLDYSPPFAREGLTFGEVMLLRAQPALLTPPLEGSLVLLCSEVEAGIAYDFGAMFDDTTGSDFRLPIGLLRNGLAATAGPAYVDVRDLYGERAGHLNVNGQAGRGTKSSFLLVVIRMSIDFARQWDNGNPDRLPFGFRPIVFNVKGNDLMYIDMPNRGLTPARQQIWNALGVQPRPFEEARFLAPCRSISGQLNRDLPRVLRPVPDDRQARTYYWTLGDVVGFGLWQYLFSETDQQSEAFKALVENILDKVAEPCDPDPAHPAGLRLRAETADPASDNGDPEDVESSLERLRRGQRPPGSFAELRQWLGGALRNNGHPARDQGVHTFNTYRALLSRLSIVLGQEGRAIFDDEFGQGRPLQVLGSGTTDPVVIDIAALPAELRRFVVAAVLDQIKENQMGPNRIPGQVYAVVLDELGVYAPRGARDPITRLFEHVAAQLRSQGIILLGAQQQASKVSETIFGNAEVKALGATSPVELESPAWSHLLTQGQKARALQLQPDEKLVLTGRGWMNVVVPYPAWAMKESEAEVPLPAGNDGPAGDLAPAGAAQFPINLPES